MHVVMIGDQISTVTQREITGEMLVYVPCPLCTAPFGSHINRDHGFCSGYYAAVCSHSTTY